VEKQTTLRITGDQWELELTDGTRLAVAGPVKKAAKNQLKLNDEDDGAVVKALLQKNHGLNRTDVKRITEIVEPSARLAEEARKAAQLVPQAPARAPRPGGDRSAGSSRAGRDLHQVYSSTLHEAPEVNTYTFLPYAVNPPSDRFGEPRDRTAPLLNASDDSSKDLYSGQIDLELEVATPLCIFGGERAEPATHRFQGRGMQLIPENARERQGHKHAYPLGDADGRPIIPGSSIKGVTRSWLEAITSSERRADEAPVAWRSTAVGKHRRLAVLTLKDAKGEPVTLSARRKDRDGRPILPAVAHATLQPIRTWDAGVGELPSAQRLQARFKATLNTFAVEGSLTDGMAVRGKTNAEHGRLKVGVSMQGDVSVHVGLSEQRTGPVIELDREVLQTWLAAHADAGDTRRPNIKPQYREPGAEPLDPTALPDDALVWYQQDDVGRITYLGRLRNGRWAELEPLAGKEPAGHEPIAHDRLRSPVHQMLGFADDHGAASGKVRFAPAVCTSEQPSTSTYTLRALTSPKLSSAGLYVDGRAQNVSWAPREDDEVWLRGTKVYWHTVPAPDAGFSNDARVACEGLVDGVPAKTTQNRTVTAITQGSFRTTISFEDLTRRELGALLLAVSLHFEDGERTVGWKLGIGRPVGLGSLVNRVVSMRLRDDAWAGDPLAPGWEDATGRLEEFLEAARAYYLPNRGDLETLAGIADHYTMVERVVGYPARGQLKRHADGMSIRQPNAQAVIRGSKMIYGGAARGHR
jgi:CRISPR-associated protein (TIGR03986 family)